MPITVNMHLRETAQVEVVDFNAFRSIRFVNADMESVDVFVRRDQYESFAVNLRKAADALQAPLAATEQVEGTTDEGTAEEHKLNWVAGQIDSVEL